MTTIDDLRAELVRERAAHAATRQVLEDAVRDRGGVVVLSAEQVAEAIDLIRQQVWCCDRRSLHVPENHFATCEISRALRIIGGPEETQRQVDEAHAWALEMESHRQKRLTVERQERERAEQLERDWSEAIFEASCIVSFGVVPTSYAISDIIDGDPRE